MKRKQDYIPRLPLNSELEQAALCGMIEGSIALSKVHPEELSKDGQLILKALTELTTKERKISSKTLFLHATEVLGADPDTMKPYLKAIEKAQIPQIEEILDALARKTIINELVNEASTQIANGSYSLLTLKNIVGHHAADRNDLVPLYADMKDVTPPEGLQLPGLTALNRSVGGLFGLWVLSGMPGAGKSTLALMISLLVAALYRPVLYYDFEQGTSVIRYHAHTALCGDNKRIKQATERLYIRHNILMIERDLEKIGEPCLIVVDSIQKVANGTTFRRESLDTWIHKLEGLKQDGHHLIFVSEKNRAHYDDPSMSGSKESGEIEYAADTILDLLLPDPDNSSQVDVHVVKNRHHKFKGHLTTLNRVDSFWFRDTTLQAKELD